MLQINIMIIDKLQKKIIYVIKALMQIKFHLKLMKLLCKSSVIMKTAKKKQALLKKINKKHKKKHKN